MSEKEESSKLISIKECPSCGGELEKGYAHAGRGIYWDTERHKFIFDAGETIIRMDSWHQYAPALRCSTCRVLVLDYGATEWKWNNAK
jgi:hypothetical protein